MYDDTEDESTEDETTEDAVFNEEATTCSDFHRLTNPYFQQDK